MKKIRSLYLLLMLCSSLLMGQEATNYIGGNLLLRFSQNTSTQSGRTFAVTDQSSLGVGIAPYYYIEKGNKGFGAGLSLRATFITRRQNSQQGPRLSQTLGGNVFWRFLLLQPSARLQIFLSPKLQVNYHNIPNNPSGRSRRFGYSIIASVGPTITCGLSERFRLLLVYDPLSYLFSSSKDEGIEGRRYSQVLELSLRPDAGILGLEYAF